MAMAFGLSIVAAAYGLGAISGAQLTPAVSLGFPAAGRMTVGDFVTYVIAQIIGAILAALVITLIAQGHEGYSVAANGLGQNGFGAGYNGPYTLAAALLFEFVATFLFVTGDKVPSKTMQVWIRPMISTPNQRAGDGPAASGQGAADDNRRDRVQFGPHGGPGIAGRGVDREHGRG